MNKYTVTAQVDSPKFGKGKLVADLSHEELINYANLTDQEKFSYLKEHGARLEVDLNELTGDDVSAYQVDGKTMTPSNLTQSRPRSQRKMRLNINGQDTGWVDVTDENEDQYKQILDQFNRMQDEFNHRFKTLFGNTFLPWLGSQDKDMIEYDSK